MPAPLLKWKIASPAVKSLDFGLEMHYIIGLNHLQSLKKTATLSPGGPMRTHRVVFFIFMLALLLPILSAQAQEGPYQLVRIPLSPGQSITPLQMAGLDIAAIAPGEYVEIVCHPADLDVIRNLGYQYQVTIADMERYYAERSGSRSMGGFHSWSESVTYLDSIHALYPNITTAKFSVGNTIEGRPMWAIKVSDNPNVDEDEPEVFFNGMIHAREPIGMEICLELLHRLTSQYGSVPQITNLVNSREIYILPVLNVDGYVYNEQESPQGGGMWRKNRRNNGGSFGVDLNRNFGFNWGYNNIGSSGSPSSETYRGASAFSEPETENIRQFCNQRYFGLALNFHSYQGLMLYSWSIPYAPWGYTPDNTTFQAMSQTMQQWNGYTFGPAWEVLYEVNGDANDWMYGEQNEKPKTLAWVFEVGTTGFWPAQSEIQGLVNAEINPCLYLIDRAANYAPSPVMLAYASGVINDAGGNNNGSLDPGETVTFIPTLRNNGWVTATNLSADFHLLRILISPSLLRRPPIRIYQRTSKQLPTRLMVSRRLQRVRWSIRCSLVCSGRAPKGFPIPRPSHWWWEIRSSSLRARISTAIGLTTPLTNRRPPATSGWKSAPIPADQARWFPLHWTIKPSSINYLSRSVIMARTTTVSRSAPTAGWRWASKPRTIIPIPPFPTVMARRL